jgi:hypothetical protein
VNIETREQPDGSKSLYYYDDENKEVLVEDYDSTGNIIMSIEREYNESSLCSGWSMKDSSGELIKRFVVNFDEKGNELNTLQYDANGNLEESFSPTELKR